MSLFLRACQYIAAMCVVMALTALGLFLVLLGEVLTLSVDLVEIIVDGFSLLFEVHATGLVLWATFKHSSAELTPTSAVGHHRAGVQPLPSPGPAQQRYTVAIEPFVLRSLSHAFVFLFLPFWHSVTLDELGTEASQAYPNDHSINIDLQQVHDLPPIELAHSLRVVLANH